MQKVKGQRSRGAPMELKRVKRAHWCLPGNEIGSPSTSMQISAEINICTTCIERGPVPDPCIERKHVYFQTPPPMQDDLGCDYI